MASIAIAALALGLFVWLCLRSARRKPASPRRWLALGPDGDATADLATTSWCDLDIVGESFHQDALARLVAAAAEPMPFHCRATLRPEPENPHDHNAIAVDIEGVEMGHLPRATATAYVLEMKRLGFAGRRVSCPAYICGGPTLTTDEGEPGMYGVKLGLVWPIRVAP